MCYMTACFIIIHPQGIHDAVLSCSVSNNLAVCFWFPIMFVAWVCRQRMGLKWNMMFRPADMSGVPPCFLGTSEEEMYRS